MSNKYIPLTITKQYDGTEYTYVLTKVTPNKVIPNKETTAMYTENIENSDNVDCMEL